MFGPQFRLKWYEGDKMEFKDFLMKEYQIGEKSAQDYVGRFNGIRARGIYNGENEFISSMKVAIENEYPN